MTIFKTITAALPARDPASARLTFDQENLSAEVETEASRSAQTSRPMERPLLPPKEGELQAC